MIVDKTSVSEDDCDNFFISLIYKAYVKLRSCQIEEEGRKDELKRQNPEKIEKDFREEIQDFTNMEYYERNVVKNDDDEVNEQWRILLHAKNGFVASSLDFKGESFYPIKEAFFIDNLKNKKKIKALRLFGSNDRLEEYKGDYKEDNNFVISYESWRKKFKKLYIWHNFDKSPTYLFSAWKYKQSTICKNEKTVTIDLVESKSEAWITLMQKLPDPNRSISFHKMNFTVQKVLTADEKAKKKYDEEEKKQNKKEEEEEFETIMQTETTSIWQISKRIPLNGPRKFNIKPMIVDQQREGIFTIGVLLSVDSSSKTCMSFDYPESERIDKKNSDQHKQEALPIEFQIFILRRRPSFFVRKL